MHADERARKNEAIILQELNRIGLESISAVVKRDPSTISRWRDENIHRLAVLLSLCDLKVVPVTFRCTKPKVLESLRELSRIALEQDDSALFGDD